MSTLHASHAQETTGYALDRFQPAERGSHWFVLDGLDLRGHLRAAAGATFDYAHKPLVVYDAAGNERTAIIKHQLFAHVGAALVMWERLRVGFSLPIALVQSGDAARANGATFTAPDKAALGDLRLSGDVRLIGEYRSLFTAALGVSVFLPTGNRDQYAGEGAARLWPRLTLAGEVSKLVWSARVNFVRSFAEGNFAGQPKANELGFGLAVGIRTLDEKLLIGPELYGNTILSSEGTAFARKTTPFEVLFGGHYRAGDFLFGLGAGPGLTRGFGSPQFRIVGSIEWAPDIEKVEPKKEEPPPPKKVEPKDTDGDGIYDDVDACPDKPGPKTDDPKTTGCPPPPKDTDGDGVPDAVDACPETPGVKTEDPKTNGCPPPPPDTDGDGILDPEDACPKDPGPKDPDPTKNGCPKVAIVGTQIKILDQVKFKTNSAIILPESDTILEGVFKVLKDHPEITKVRVEGHTDNKGAPAYNKDLSKKRAAAVVAWLVKKGIDPKRLVSAGFGQEKPIDTNDTDAGRQNNRRVEFHIEGNPTITEPKSP